MAVEDFIKLSEAKKTVEKEVPRKPSIAELTTVEVPGRPSPANLLEEESEGKEKKVRTTRKKEKGEAKIIKDKNSILIITEKPQAAMKIAAALGKARKYSENGVSYYEVQRGDKTIIVASAVGHLFNLNYVKGQKGWPIFDVEWRPAFEKKNSAFTKKYYMLLKKLSARASEFFVATDFDTEGEVIGWNVLRFICKQKNAKRMKFSTLTAKELETSFENPLGELAWGNAYAGETRHILDWFYGINLSRALMSAIKLTGSFRILSIGRVQGPALKIIVDREKEIDNFKPVPYWQVFAFSNKIRFKHPRDVFKEKELEIFKNIKEALAETKKTEEKLTPPVPFDLTTLQREAYRLFHINPSATLAIAQKLYLEGLISYPRTSSQKIPEAIEPKKIIETLKKRFPEAKYATRQKPFEGKKSDPAHPSIYPTGDYKELKEQDEKLYLLIVKRFLSAFSPDAITANKRIVLSALDKKGKPIVIQVESNPETKNPDEDEDSDEEKANLEVKLKDYKITFTASAQTILEKGWLNVYPIKIEESELPDFSGKVKIDKIEFEKKETQPPNRFTPASLVSLLEKKNLGTKCLTSDTNIIVNNKEMPMKELFDSGGEHKNKEGVETRKIEIKTISLNEEKGEVSVKKSGFITRRNKDETEEIIKIETPNSLIKSTGGHLIYIYDNVINNKPANNLKINDKVIAITYHYEEGEKIYEFSQISNNYKIIGGDILHKFGKAKKGIRLTSFPIRWSTSLAWILGYFYGDGSYSNPRYGGSHQIYFTTTEKKALDLLIKNIKNVFGNEPYYYDLNGKYKVNLNCAMSAVLIKIFPSLEGKLPINLPEEFIGDFLRGFFDADGNVHLRHEGKTKIKGISCNSFATPRVKITLANETLIKWVSSLLTKLKIENHINKNIAKCKGKIFHCWTILISGKEKTEKYAIRIGFDSYKEDILFKGLKCSSPHYDLLRNSGKIYFKLTKGGFNPEKIAKECNMLRYDVMRSIKHLSKFGLISKKRIGNRTKQKWIYSLKNRKPEYDRYYIKLLFEKIGKNIYAIPIENISKESYNGYVYDISVDEDSPNFLINGNLLVHNSTRSSIIETLFTRGYLDGQSIKATPLGMGLISTLEKHSSIIIDENLTRQLEEEMEKIQDSQGNLEQREKEVVEKAKKIIIDISKEFKAKEMDIGKELAKGLETLRKEQNENNTLMPCPTCKKGNLRIMFNRKSRRYFVACSAYPDCKQTYSLPPNALIKKVENDKRCEADNFPKLLAIRKAKRPWEFCFNPECPVEKKKRDEWAARKNSGQESNEDEEKIV